MSTKFKSNFYKTCIVLGCTMMFFTGVVIKF